MEKRDLAEEVLGRMQTAHDRVHTKYDLVANIVHEGPAEAGEYRCHVLHRPTGKWFELQDLAVSTTDSMAELVALSQTMVQLYELK